MNQAHNARKKEGLEPVPDSAVEMVSFEQAGPTTGCGQPSGGRHVGTFSLRCIVVLARCDRDGLSSSPPPLSGREQMVLASRMSLLTR